MNDENAVASFLRMAQENELAAISHYERFLAYIERVDQLMRKLMNARKGDKVLARVMIMVAHAYFLSAIRVALSGQSPSSFTNLRASIESALYALIMQNEEGAADVWLNRAKDRDACRTTFTIGKGFRLLDFDPNLKALARQVYDASIDFGAHPNPIAVMKNVRVEDNGTAHRVSLTSHHGTDSFSVARTLIACVESGFASTLIFTQTFQDDTSRDVHKSAFDMLTEFHEFLKVEGFSWTDEESRPG